jgi:integrase/recombinase XerD
MTLLDTIGQREYLTPGERGSFITTAENAPREVRTFCCRLAYTGCRVAEALELTADRVDLKEGRIVFESLKKRRKGLAVQLWRGAGERAGRA